MDQDGVSAANGPTSGVSVVSATEEGVPVATPGDLQGNIHRIGGRNRRQPAAQAARGGTRSSGNLSHQSADSGRCGIRNPHRPTQGQETSRACEDGRNRERRRHPKRRLRRDPSSFRCPSEPSPSYPSRRGWLHGRESRSTRRSLPKYDGTLIMATQHVQLIDPHRSVVATAQIAEEGNHYEGTIDLRMTPPKILALLFKSSRDRQRTDVRLSR